MELNASSQSWPHRRGVGGGLLQRYVERARPVLTRASANDWLFAGERPDRISEEAFVCVLERVRAATAKVNPDLEELADKHLTPHSLRVSFAKLLFDGGCNIRSINELMQHESLSTTARYTPIPLADLHRACRQAHPRA